MNDKRQLIPALGLLATFVAAIYMVVQLGAQAANPAGDFSSAAVAEVRDGEGRLLLSGPFQLSEEDDDDIERKAVLMPTGVVADAAGAAEVEFSRSAPALQEIEFSVRNVLPGTTMTFAIDGTEVATATADASGRAKVELEIRLAGS